MPHFGPWELVAFGGLWIGAFILAVDTGLRMAPDTRRRVPQIAKVLRSRIWGFAPLLLLTISGLIFVGTATGLINSASRHVTASSNANETSKIQELEEKLKSAHNQIADLMSRVRPRYVSLNQHQVLGRELALPDGVSYSVGIQQEPACSDCASYAGQLLSAFQSMKGWTISPKTIVFSLALMGRRGVALVCHKGSNPASSAVLQKALKAADIRFHNVTLDYPSLMDTCVIYVGASDGQ